MMTDTARSQKRIAILVATLSSFNGPFLSSSVVVALPSIGREFQMEPLLLGWISTAYLLTIASLVIPFGRMGDIYGHKKISLGGLVALIAASWLIASCHSGSMIILGRALQGIAFAMFLAVMIPMLLSAIPFSERGQALGIATASTYFGLSAGPFLGGIITHYLGWRFIFWSNIGLSFIILVLTFFMYKDTSAEAHGERFDLAGAILFGFGILATMYGFSTLPSMSAALSIAAGMLGLVLFVCFEMRTAHPIVDINLIRHNAAFAFSNLAALINYAANYAVSFLLSLYLQKVKSLTPEFAGLVLVAQPIIQAIFSPLAGRLSDRMEPRLLASWGMACSSLGLTMLAFLDAGSTILYIVICQMILGFGFALFSSPNTNAVMSSVDSHMHGVAGAALSTMRQVGMTFSMGIVMMAMSFLMGKSEITPDNPGQFLASMKISFGIFAVMCFGGIFASLARGNIKRAHQS